VLRAHSDRRVKRFQYAIHVGSPAGYQGRRIRFRPAAHGSGHHTAAAPDFHDAEFVAVAGREEELHAVDQLFVPLPAQVLDVALPIDFDVMSGISRDGAVSSRGRGYLPSAWAP
jgi:hypothetical protein